MFKRISTKDAFQTEEAARKAWEGNEEFLSFIKQNREDTYNAIVGNEGGENDWQKVLTPGIMPLVRYAVKDKEFDTSLMTFTDALIRNAKKLQNARQKRNELWKIIFTLDVAQNVENIDKSNGLFTFIRSRVEYALYTFLWRDYCKLNEPKETDEPSEQ